MQVFGVPDERFGEELCAWIRLRPGTAMTEEEARGSCRGRIAPFKVPRHVRFVEAFPATVAGKKFLMRRRMIEELGLRAQATA